MDTSNMTKAELDFATIYGTLFSLSTTIEYLISVKALLREINAKNAANKAHEAEYACETIYNTLQHEMTKKMTAAERAVAIAAIDHHKETVYGFFVLTSDNQRRVKGLIDKLRKEQLK